MNKVNFLVLLFYFCFILTCYYDNTKSPYDPRTLSGFYLTFCFTGILNCDGKNLSNNTNNNSINNPSCNPCRIFVSTNRYDGNLGGITGADNICNNDPNKPNTSLYKALLVDGTNRVACISPNCSTNGISEHIDWVLKPNTTYIRANGSTFIFTTNSDGIFIFGTANNSISDGPPSTIYFIWTGLNQDWTIYTFSSTERDCNDWNSNSSAYITKYGKSTFSDYNMISFGIDNCNQVGTASGPSSYYHLYCVEQ
ncbi:MAG: hypothetical protein KatS3mg129_1243 [Leptospiraceae bacterium]|nr:MAG: hypothetical protein KatS3mg129_1243 [Leptospiraceae bacterium]